MNKLGKIAMATESCIGLCHYCWVLKPWIIAFDVAFPQYKAEDFKKNAGNCFLSVAFRFLYRNHIKAEIVWSRCK